MHTLLQINDRRAIVERIERLTPQHERLWGTMTVHQMLCHCTDQLRMAAGELPSLRRDSRLSRTLVKRLVLAGMPAPRGKVQTVPELHQSMDGTRPTEFEADRRTLIDYINRFAGPPAPAVVHPAFGPMSHEEWARFGWLHLNHHLKQFGV